jgi:hypothetical protein
MHFEPFKHQKLLAQQHSTTFQNNGIFITIAVYLYVTENRSVWRFLCLLFFFYKSNDLGVV